MADRCNADRMRSLPGLLDVLLGHKPPPRALSDFELAAPPAATALPVSALRHYLVTVTEGPWDDWFMAVSVIDERGRRVASAVADEGVSHEVLLSGLLTEAEEAIGDDFLARRPKPGWLEERRRALICRTLWLRNRGRRLRGHRRRR